MPPKRYHTLDAARGLAAIAVVYYHVWPLVDAAADKSYNLRFGYLAVDLFFGLSGFVIAHTYDVRFRNGLSWRAFIKARAIRLWPTYLIGVALGLILVLHSGAPLLEKMTETGSALLMLPAPVTARPPILVPVLPVAWSLVAEFWIANLGFALTWRWLSTRVLSALALGGLVGLVVMTGVYRTADVGALWPDFPGLVVRVVFSFSVGVLISRWHDVWAPPAVPAWVVLLAILATFTPRLSAYYGNGYEVICIIAVYPSLIYLAARAELHSRLGKLLGEASYALYVIHFPLFLIAQKLQAEARIAGSQALAVGFIAVACALAYGIGQIEPPVRRWLTQRFSSLTA